MYNFSRFINISSKYVNQNIFYQLIRLNVHTIAFTKLRSEECVLTTRLQNIPTPTIHFFRSYAKSKDKKKEKGKAKVQINENQLSEVINVETLKNQLQRPIEILKDEFVKNLSIRTNTGAIETLTVNFDGQDHTIQELGQVVRKNPSMTIVNMAVFPQALPAVLKAIQKSGMNLNPQQEGTSLIIPVPKVTTEHRENLVKNAKKLFIKCRDSLKDVQVKQIKGTKKKQNVSEDILIQTEQQIITMVDNYITQAQTIYDNKCNELLNK